MVTKKYEDLEGKEIGTKDNLENAYFDVLTSIGKEMGCFHIKKEINVDEIKDRINIYKAVKYCYDGDTSNEDHYLNHLMKEIPGLSGELIKTSMTGFYIVNKNEWPEGTKKNPALNEFGLKGGKNYLSMDLAEKAREKCNIPMEQSKAIKVTFFPNDMITRPWAYKCHEHNSRYPKGTKFLKETG